MNRVDLLIRPLVLGFDSSVCVRAWLGLDMGGFVFSCPV
jgi:hypothetical protein